MSREEVCKECKNTNGEHLVGCSRSRREPPADCIHAISQDEHCRYCTANELASLRAERDELALERDALKRAALCDWAEDFADTDNGEYRHLCPSCGMTFSGHKRRVGECKRCWIKFAEQIVIKHNSEAHRALTENKEQKILD